MFETDLISWWIYKLNYGKEYKPDCLTEDDKEIDVSTVDKLYDALIKNYERKKSK